MAAAAYTVREAMANIGIDDNSLWNGQTQAERIAAEVFDDDFNSCMDITSSEIDDSFKMYSALTVVNGQIRLRPNEK